MPKRGRGGSRGGSRGGRGRPSRGGRGGYIGRGKGKKKHQKRQGQGPGQPINRDFPELFDLNNPDFISVTHPQSSMRAAAARGSKRKFKLQDEVFNTEDNIENTMNLPLRKRPVEFIKASTLDPSKDLKRKLKEKDEYVEKINNNEVTFVSEEAKVQEETDILPTPPETQVEAEIIEDNTMNDAQELSNDTENPIFESSKSESVRKPKKEKSNGLEQVPDDLLFFKDEEGDLELPSNVQTVTSENIQKQIALQPSFGNLEFTPTISIGHTILSTSQNEDGELYTKLPNNGKGEQMDFDPDQSIYEVSNGKDDLIDMNKGGKSNDLYQSYNQYISRVMQNLANTEHEDDEDDENDNDDSQYDEEQQDLYAELDDDFEEEAKFIANVSDDEDIGGSNDDETARELDKLNIDEQANTAATTPEDPEYGFLPEDYESFDVSLVDVINIRYGAGSNLYHIKSFQLTGSYDFEWIDQDLFKDFLLENGMLEHRLNAYFKYVQKQLTPDEPDEKDFDLPISDSDEEDEEQDIESDRDDYDDEGLDELVKYTTKYDGVRDMEFDTKTLTTRGTGRKKELNLDHVADMDLRQSLADQYQATKKHKKEKRRDREQNIAKEHASSKDLSLKYPYTIYVNDFKTEFEGFLQDGNRQALTFPPLDPHGNKVVMKFAFFYNMKSRKFGSGKQQHVVAVKNKRTFHSLPDYHSVNMLCKQRPVFNRIDQKRPRVEIESEESKSSRRGKPSKAHVKEGQIVGEDAPEISTDNIGRRLLEKLGWKAGQGLGSDNRGIPEPVIAKVKKTKLGLR